MIKTNSTECLTSRRAFLRHARTAASVFAASCLARTNQVSAIDPFARPSQGPLKLSLSAYSFRDQLTKSTDDPDFMSLFNLIDYCREHEVSGIELTSYYFPPDYDQNYLMDLRRYCHVQGVSISGGAIRNDFCVTPSKLPEQINNVRKWIDAYSILGAPVIRIFAGSVPQGVTNEEAIERCVQACNEVCRYAAEKGVFLALENHHGITDTADLMLQIVRAVQSDWFGVNLDSGNFKIVADPYSELEKIAPYAINAQIKVDMWSGDKKVPADLARIVDILRNAKYSGWVVLEYEGEAPASEAVPKYLQELAQLLA